MMCWLKEVGLVMGQSIRMLIKNRYAVVLMAVGIGILGAMLFCMEDAKEEKSKLVIGIADEDDSALSRAVTRAMIQTELYEVIPGEEKQLAERLQEGGLAAVCVLKQGLEQEIIKGNTSALITVYETTEQSAPLLGDILAGAMMQEICMAKGYLTLLEYEEKTGREAALSGEEYRSYVQKIAQEAGVRFRFDIAYVDSGIRVQKPTAQMLYEQAVFAVFALMLGLFSVYAVLPFRSIRHGHFAKRLKTLPLSEGAMYTGGAMGAVLVPLLFSAVFVLGFGIKNEVEGLKIISILICTLVYICVIVCIMLFAAYGIQSQTVYQMGMLAMILIFGVFGLVSLVDGLLLPEGVAEWVPNGWYVRRVTEILHQ